MPIIEIEIDSNVSGHEQVAEALQKELRGASSLKVTTITKPSEPGTLGPGADIVKFVIEHHEPLLLWVPPLLTVIGTVVKLLAPKDSKPVIIVVESKRLPVPPSPDSTKKFLKAIARPDTETDAQEPTRKKTTPRRRTRQAGRRRA